MELEHIVQFGCMCGQTCLPHVLQPHIMIHVTAEMLQIVARGQSYAVSNHISVVVYTVYMPTRKGWVCSYQQNIFSKNKNKKPKERHGQLMKFVRHYLHSCSSHCVKYCTGCIAVWLDSYSPWFNINRTLRPKGKDIWI